MLNTFYTTLFRPRDSQGTAAISLMIGGLTVLVLALNTAGVFHAGTSGLMLILLLFVLAGGLGCYWLATSLHFCAQLLGGQGTSGQTFQAVVRGLWPLLLSGSAIASKHLSPTLGSLFTLGILIGTLITLAGSVRQVHQLSWVQAAVGLSLTLGVSGLALLGLILWPLMLVGGL
ncbi:hypothetical protein C1752_01903 [Acaryochloris thomasi RCC1774]|uniref:Yip1 domain-containing protein n=1 Tax=Acaryochloris thomasi RCC1774 TaxID=1764569 RepID=A0A2W1JJL4_9CYAN|nr:YIP1 family protein [Acaryochloris thomasi]PZD73599.1 hypothetical protein C1752_01903 [Acaryochloris thomasi RCC1774]